MPDRLCRARARLSPQPGPSPSLLGLQWGRPPPPTRGGVSPLAWRPDAALVPLLTRPAPPRPFAPAQGHKASKLRPSARAAWKKNNTKVFHRFR